MALGVTLVVAGALASACGSDDGGGGSGGSGTGGKDGGSGGSTGGGGGTGGGTGGGGTGGSGGCPAAPDPNEANACDTCQDTDHMDCACESEQTACEGDTDCSAIWDCVAGLAGGPACDTFDEAGAACVHACIAQNPAGKAKYLAMEKCGYCTYCGAACDTGTYCTALDNPPDGGTGDSGSDATTEGGSDATTEGGGDAATEAGGDAATD